MSAKGVPGYVTRVRRLIDALDILRLDGPLELSELAARTSSRAEHLRSDFAILLEAGAVDVLDGGLYAVSDDDAFHGLGLERIGVLDAAALWLQGQTWLPLVPPEAAEHLAAALNKLLGYALGPSVENREDALPRVNGDVGRILTQACDQRRRVEIRYARAWQPGVSVRVIEPLAFHLTRRGPEVDAGPLDERGRLRTFLLSGVVEARLLDSNFEEPSLQVRRALTQARALTTVRLVVPQGWRWLVEQYAEHLTVDAQDDDLALTCTFLDPVRERLGVILTTIGPQAFIVDPGYDGVREEHARGLLRLYHLSD